MGVELILAHSPQAKGAGISDCPATGRVERRNAVFQDRLVKASGIGDCPRAEMRLRNISDRVRANVLLEGSFLQELNRRFAVKPAADTDLHRALGPDVALEETLCVQGERVVGLDWCVRWDNRWLQIGPEHGSMNLPRRRVAVKQLPGGRLLLEHQGRKLSFEELAAKPEAPKCKKPIVNNRRYKPGQSHPWKCEPAVGPRPPVSPAPAAPARDLRAGKKKAG